MLVEKVLVVQTAFLGDLLLSIPLLKALKKEFPKAKIDLVAKKPLGAFFAQLGLVDQVFEIEKSQTSTYKKALIDINKKEYDYLICLHESLRSHFFAKKIRAKEKISYKKWWNYSFFSKRVDRKKTLAEPLRALQLMRPISASWVQKLEFLEEEFLQNKESRESTKLKYFIPQELSMKLSIALKSKEEGPYIVLAPGSVWHTKKWPTDYYASLAKKLMDKKNKVILVGAKEESQTCEMIKSQVPEVVNLCGETSLLELAAIIKEAKVLVSNDSGPMHIAALFNTPNLSIFGPTTLELGYRPWQNNAYVVQKDIICRPCGKHGHKECPIGTHECMKSISVGSVETALKEVVNEMA